MKYLAAEILELFASAARDRKERSFPGTFSLPSAMMKS